MNKQDLLRIRYFFYCLLNRNGFAHAEFLKKHKCFYNMGNSCFFQPYNMPADSQFIRFGNNVVVASNVSFICHDVMHLVFNNMSSSHQSVYETYWNVIDVRDNVFIGANSTILAGVTIGENSVIAAGAVVVNDIPPNTIVGGVPAKTIGNFDLLAKKECHIVKVSKVNGRKKKS